METIVKQIEYLRREIASRDSQLMAGVMVLAVLITAGYIAAVITQNQQLYRLPVMLLLTGIFFVARQEYLEKRIAPWIVKAEAFVHQLGPTDSVPEGFVNWEKYLASLKSRYLYLLPTDVLCGTAFFWMFASLNPLVSFWVVTDEVFYPLAGAGIVFAILWVFVGRGMADM